MSYCGQMPKVNLRLHTRLPYYARSRLPLAFLAATCNLQSRLRGRGGGGVAGWRFDSWITRLCRLYSLLGPGTPRGRQKKITNKKTPTKKLDSSKRALSFAFPRLCLIIIIIIIMIQLVNNAASAKPKAGESLLASCMPIAKQQYPPFLCCVSLLL